MALNKNSLFAVLLRSPWWISIAATAGEITENARAFRAGNNIRLLDGGALAKPFPGAGI